MAVIITREVNDKMSKARQLLEAAGIRIKTLICVQHCNIKC